MRLLQWSCLTVLLACATLMGGCSSGNPAPTPLGPEEERRYLEELDKARGQEGRAQPVTPAQPDD